LINTEILDWISRDADESRQAGSLQGFPEGLGETIFFQRDVEVRSAGSKKLKQKKINFE